MFKVYFIVAILNTVERRDTSIGYIFGTMRFPMQS